MSGPAPSEAPSRRFPPRPESVASARRFVRSALSGTAPDVAETAELLAGELVTNAVLHARTEVEVRVDRTADRVHVAVADRRPDRGPVPHSWLPYAGTGRGLKLLEELSAIHGVRIGDNGKTVWFELWPDKPVPPSSPWDAVPSPGRTVTVTLIDLPYALHAAAQQHRESLLRELALLSFGPAAHDLPGDLARQELLTALDTSNLISACTTAAVQEEAPDSSTLCLRSAFPADAGPAVAALRLTLDLADSAAQQGALLTLPALPQVRSFCGWLFDQIVGQLSGGPPTAWTLFPHAPSASSTELAPWDAADVEASNVPTIAADDGNRIIAVNAAAAHLLGWQPDDLVGRRLTVLIPEHLRDRHAAAFGSLLLTGQPRILGRSIPLPALHRDGRLIPIRLRIQTQEALDGRTVFVAQLGARTAPAAPPGGDHTGHHAIRPQPGPSHPPAVRTRARAAGNPCTDDATLNRLSLLVDATSALTSTLDLTEGLHRVCRVLTRQLAQWCVVELLGEHERVERVCVVHRTPEALKPGVRLGALPPMSEETGGPLPRVLRGAGPLRLADVSSSGRLGSPLDESQEELFRQLGARTAIIAPLRARREVLGALTLVRGRDDPPFTDEDLPLVTDLVRGIALGVDNARLHEHTRRTSERMQRALLPHLPDVDHLELVARYAPSGADAQIGGDWFDAFVLPKGDTALVIGDVTGHDLQSAVAMSQLRNLLRGIAVDRQEPPAEVVHRFDLACHTLYPHATATCVYAVVKGPEGGPWELRHSSAGHPPPLLTTEQGDTRYLDAGAGPLIGLDPDLPRVTADDPLPPRSTLLMFTDGLIERRGESFGDAMTRLRQHTAALARAPLDVFCDELVLGLGTDTTDDIALLALRTPPPG
ncbi:SpoIIE family protein phosphatase [Streptomyces sp. NPDC059688]|uniref:SpoIIE family protein phosphatase n=1 Tax=Streptomyces albidocamelliae TaxID=2981135 RepID=A0ABY6EHM6_9ACTN|nr:SpoIIE family protein phosphatase [Streptomyces sp. HUAS 14-6]UXY34229.1 SpoIIE family protein phosphatase [Streptomyces sp. HUAS 14-6]